MESKSAFPSTRQEALAFLYVQNQDLSKTTPEEIAAIYDDAHTRIVLKFRELEKERKENRQNRQTYF